MKYLAILAMLAAAGCGAQQLKVEPVKVEPIHLIIDVNLHDAHAPPTQPVKP